MLVVSSVTGFFFNVWVTYTGLFISSFNCVLQKDQLGMSLLTVEQLESEEMQKKIECKMQLV